MVIVHFVTSLRENMKALYVVYMQQYAIVY